MAVALIKESFSDEANDLILHTEFDLNKELEQQLRAIFNHVFIIYHDYKKNHTTAENEYILFKKYMRFKNRGDIIRKKYDQLFLSQDELITTLIVREVSKLKKMDISYIEDGIDAYFSINRAFNELTKSKFNEQHQNKKRNRKLPQRFAAHLRTLLYGKNSFSQAKYCYGMNAMYSKSYVLFPENAREEIQHTAIKEIPKPFLLQAINTLYTNPALPQIKTEKIIIIFLDMIKRISPGLGFENFLMEILLWAKTKNVQILYKHHPGETGIYDTLVQNDTFDEISKFVPSEKVLAELSGKSVTVIGNLSTSLVVAKKMGFSVVCFGKILGIQNQYAYAFFNQIDISVPATFTELLALLNHQDAA